MFCTKKFRKHLVLLGVVELKIDFSFFLPNFQENGVFCFFFFSEALLILKLILSITSGT